MKQLPTYRWVLVLALPFVIACKNDPQSTNNTSSLIPMSPPGQITWNAHPVICYVADTNIGTAHNPSLRSGLWVMDSSGANWKCLYYNSSTGPFGGLPVSWPSWNPAGTSILWTESNGTNMYLKKIDVSVVSGVPVGSNVTTVYTLTPSDSLTFRTATWCSVSTNNVAAVGLNDLHNPASVRRSHIRLVNMANGTATEIFTSDSNFTAYTPSFNPDGSKIALIRSELNGTYRGLQVIDLSGNVLNSIALDAGISLSNLDWSRTSGKIAFGGGAADASGYVKSIDTTSGSTATSICTGLVGPSWNPTDWKIATWVGGGTLGTSSIKTVQVATGTTATIRSPGVQPNWKR
jgi:hypothetical protein